MNKKRNTIIVLVITLLVMVILGIGIWKHQKTQATIANVEAVDDEDSDIVKYNGEKYKYNSDIRTVLFLGVDKSETVSLENQPGKGGQADTILLLVLNDNKKTAQILEISRDTMTDIDIYDMSGEKLATENAQIALQYAYGNSTKKSCQIMKNIVSNLLYGVPIRSHISLNVDGIEQIVDAIGGVEITVPEDYSKIDPAFTKGAKLTLDGKQAENYVRYRDHDVLGSNDSRMERQNQFMKTLLEQIQSGKIDKNSVYDLVMNSAGDYIDTDMTAEQLNKIAEYTFDEDIIQLQGEMKSGKEHDEFYLDNDKLYELVLKTFYKQIK